MRGVAIAGSRRSPRTATVGVSWCSILLGARIVSSPSSPSLRIDSIETIPILPNLSRWRFLRRHPARDRSGEQSPMAGRPGWLTAGRFPRSKDRERSKLTAPAGVAVGGDEVFVSDVADHQIKVYSMGGRFLRSFGEPGLRPGQFSFVNGLAVGRDGNLYVADSNNRRVQVVDKQGAPVAVLDKTDQPEGMGLPRAVALDSLRPRACGRLRSGRPCTCTGTRACPWWSTGRGRVSSRRSTSPRASLSPTTPSWSATGGTAGWWSSVTRDIARYSEVAPSRAWSPKRSRRGATTPRSERGSAVGRCSSPSGSSRG